MRTNTFLLRCGALVDGQARPRTCSRCRFCVAAVLLLVDMVVGGSVCQHFSLWEWVFS